MELLQREKSDVGVPPAGVAQDEALALPVALENREEEYEADELPLPAVALAEGSAPEPVGEAQAEPGGLEVTQLVGIAVLEAVLVAPPAMDALGVVLGNGCAEEVGVAVGVEQADKEGVGLTDGRGERDAEPQKL